MKKIPTLVFIIYVSFFSCWAQAIKISSELGECDQSFIVDEIETSQNLLSDWQVLLFKQGSVQRNKQGFISFKAFNNLNEAVLIDIRSSEQFSRFHIAQSMNISAQELSNKLFLKNKPLVLINQGFATTTMKALYQRLLALGFTHVAILDGGLQTWLQAGKKLVGERFLVSQIKQINAQQLFLEKKYQDLVVLELSAENSTATIKKRYGTLFKNNRVVVVNETGTDYEKIAQAIKPLNAPLVFFLEGGKPAYHDYLLKQQAIWNRPQQKQGKVNTCGRRKR